jgi:hypothetical protein
MLPSIADLPQQLCFQHDIDPHRPKPRATDETLVDVANPTLLEAVEAWRPDPDCIAAGDEHCELAARCYAAAGLSDRLIRGRLLFFAGPEIDPLDLYDAALALARHGAIVGASAPEIVAWLAFSLASARQHIAEANGADHDEDLAVTMNIGPLVLTNFGPPSGV